jgi:hypothetical protein
MTGQPPAIAWYETHTITTRIMFQGRQVTGAFGMQTSCCAPEHRMLPSSMPPKGQTQAFDGMTRAGGI